MSSKLIRRIAALVVAVVVSFGAAASSAHAADWSPASTSHVVTADSPALTPVSPCRSSWS